MTPQLWHAVAIKVAPFKRKLFFCGVVAAIITAVFFADAQLYQQYSKWLFLGLWLSTVVLFWCFGLLLVSRLYSQLPLKRTGVLSGFNYYWNLIVGWYGALFLAIWFLGLAFASFVAPFLILFGHDS